MNKQQRQYNINPLNLRYRWHHLTTGATGVKRFENSLTQAEIDYRMKIRFPLEPRNLHKAVEKWNASAPNVWRYEVITEGE